MDRVLIVTGASRDPGIGSAVAKQAAEQGWKVIVNGRSAPEWQHNNVQFVPGDITEEFTQQMLINSAIDEWSRIDAIVHNAALTNSVTPPAGRDWMEEYAINVVAPYQLTEKAKSWLTASRGAVVMVGSRSGVRPNPQNSIAYSVSKSAMHYLAKELAARFAPIRVNAVAPGLTLSARQLDKWESPRWKADVLKNWEENSLLPGFVEVSQVAESVLYLLDAKNTTGVVLDVDNGVNL